MSKNNDNLYRIAGGIGLITLLGLVLWTQNNQKSLDHDHGDPAQHGNKITSASLRDSQILSPSGTLKDGTRVVDYNAYQYRFEPDPLVVYSAERVELRVKSNDVTHGIMIPEINFSTQIPIKKRKSVSFNAPDKPGVYPVFCSVFCGSDHGNMTGKLVVLPIPQNKGDTDNAHSN